MKKRIKRCPNCQQNTLQFESEIATKKWSNESESSFKTHAWYCSKCTHHIVILKMDKSIDTTKPYDLEELGNSLHA